MSWISSVYLMLFLEITVKWLKMILCVVEAQRIWVVGATVPPFGVCRASSVIPAPFVIPAKAGIQSTSRRLRWRVISLDTGFRRHDGLSAAMQTSPSFPRRRESSKTNTSVLARRDPVPPALDAWLPEPSAPRGPSNHVATSAGGTPGPRSHEQKKPRLKRGFEGT